MPSEIFSTPRNEIPENVFGGAINLSGDIAAFDNPGLDFGLFSATRLFEWLTTTQLNCEIFIENPNTSMKADSEDIKMLAIVFDDATSATLFRMGIKSDEYYKSSPF